MASRVSCFRETARQGRPRLVRAFIYLSIYAFYAIAEAGRSDGWSHTAVKYPPPATAMRVVSAAPLHRGISYSG